MSIIYSVSVPVKQELVLSVLVLRIFYNYSFVLEPIK